MKKIMTTKMVMAVTVALAAVTLFGAPASAKKKSAKGAIQAMAGNDDGPSTVGKEAKVLIDQMPKTGQACCFNAPGIQGGTLIGQCYKKPRQWIVIETKYTTFAKFLEQLTFTWHVMLDVKKATENKGNRAGVSAYSYFSTSTTYFNIPQGSHAACVCLPPSYLELYGAPMAIGFEVSNQNGDVLAGGTVSEIPGIKANDKFWENQEILNKAGKDGKPLVERRQGLVDRSKTIWALVNPNDYEATMQ